jgi:hypothetical protein
VGLNEDRPQHVHALALARLHVVVEDVDPSLCIPTLSIIQRQSKKSEGTEGELSRDDILFRCRCTTLTRHQRLRSGESSDRSHPILSLGRLLNFLMSPNL